MIRTGKRGGQAQRAHAPDNPLSALNPLNRRPPDEPRSSRKPRNRLGVAPGRGEQWLARQRGRARAWQPTDGRRRVHGRAAEGLVPATLKNEIDVGRLQAANGHPFAQVVKWPTTGGSGPPPLWFAGSNPVLCTRTAAPSRNDARPFAGPGQVCRSREAARNPSGCACATGGSNPVLSNRLSLRQKPGRLSLHACRTSASRRRQ